MSNRMTARIMYDQETLYFPEGRGCYLCQEPSMLSREVLNIS